MPSPQLKIVPQTQKKDERSVSEQQKPDFESTLAELERVVEGLENGELSLADQLKAFERGMELSEQCKKMLDEARLKVIELTDSDDSPETGEES